MTFSLLLLGLVLAGCNDSDGGNTAAARQKCFSDCNQDAQKAQQNNQSVPDCTKECEDNMYKNGNQSAGDEAGAAAPSAPSAS